jgi:predicted nuclease of predicted toxin-antitoxin system
LKFLVDMGIALSTASFLRAQGHDTIHLLDQGLQRVEGRVIISHDLDFGRIVGLSKRSVPSVITFRLSDMRPARVNRYLSEVLDRFGQSLEAGALVSVDERKIRIRSLPVSP